MLLPKRRLAHASPHRSDAWHHAERRGGQSAAQDVANQNDASTLLFSPTDAAGWLREAVDAFRHAVCEVLCHA